MQILIRMQILILLLSAAKGGIYNLSASKCYKFMHSLVEYDLCKIMIVILGGKMKKRELEASHFLMADSGSSTHSPTVVVCPLSVIER